MSRDTFHNRKRLREVMSPHYNNNDNDNQASSEAHSIVLFSNMHSYCHKINKMNRHHLKRRQALGSPKFSESMQEKMDKLYDKVYCYGNHPPAPHTAE